MWPLPWLAEAANRHCANRIRGAKDQRVMSQAGEMTRWRGGSIEESRSTWLRRTPYADACFRLSTRRRRVHVSGRDGNSPPRGIGEADDVVVGKAFKKKSKAGFSRRHRFARASARASRVRLLSSFAAPRGAILIDEAAHTSEASGAHLLGMRQVLPRRFIRWSCSATTGLNGRSTNGPRPTPAVPTQRYCGIVARL
jgi:hypothetical protein